MERNEFGKLPIGDIKMLRELIRNFRDDPTMSLESLFRSALLGYYDCMQDHMTKAVGHIVYRLSDFVPEQERKTMRVYPGSTEGSIIEVDKDGETVRWISLQDFRKDWKIKHPEGIPQYMKQLPSCFDLRKLPPTE